jgi:hypothetical protein
MEGKLDPRTRQVHAQQRPGVDEIVVFLDACFSLFHYLFPVTALQYLSLLLDYLYLASLHRKLASYLAHKPTHKTASDLSCVLRARTT